MGHRTRILCLLAASLLVLACGNDTSDDNGNNATANNRADKCEGWEADTALETSEAFVFELDYPSRWSASELDGSTVIAFTSDVDKFLQIQVAQGQPMDQPTDYSAVAEEDGTFDWDGEEVTLWKGGTEKRSYQLNLPVGDKFYSLSATYSGRLEQEGECGPEGAGLTREMMTTLRPNPVFVAQ